MEAPYMTSFRNVANCPKNHLENMQKSVVFTKRLLPGRPSCFFKKSEFSGKLQDISYESAFKRLA